jgi:hypothetical protein
LASNAATPFSTITVFESGAIPVSRERCERWPRSHLTDGGAEPGYRDVAGDDADPGTPPTSMATPAAPEISICVIDTSESDVCMPVPSGAAASPTMRNPSTTAS